MLKLNKLQIGRADDMATPFSLDDNNMTKGGTTYTVNRWGKVVSTIGCNGGANDVVKVGSASYRCEKPLSVGNYSYGYDQKGT